MKSVVIHFLSAILAFSLVLAPTAVRAQEALAWPQKPVRIILPAPPGAAVDYILRLLQPQLQVLWKQPVIIENKPGAGGNIALQEVARSNDEHTLFGGPDTVLTVNPHLYKKLSFSPVQDIVPITYMASFNQMLVCNPKVGITDLHSLLQAARTGPITYASSGPGGPSHMAMEMLLGVSSIKMTHVPYRGPSPAALDVVGGQVHCAFVAATVVLPFVKDGRLTALAVSGSKRSPQAPDVPTVSEAIATKFDATFFETLQAPRSMPKAIVNKIQMDVAQLLKRQETKEKLLEADLSVVANTPTEAANRANMDLSKWGSIAKSINLVLD